MGAQSFSFCWERLIEHASYVKRYLSHGVIHSEGWEWSHCWPGETLRTEAPASSHAVVCIRDGFGCHEAKSDFLVSTGSGKLSHQNIPLCTIKRFLLCRDLTSLILQVNFTRLPKARDFPVWCQFIFPHKSIVGYGYSFLPLSLQSLPLGWEKISSSSETLQILSRTLMLSHLSVAGILLGGVARSKALMSRPCSATSGALRETR